VPNVDISLQSGWFREPHPQLSHVSHSCFIQRGYWISGLVDILYTREHSVGPIQYSKEEADFLGIFFIWHSCSVAEQVEMLCFNNSRRCGCSVVHLTSRWSLLSLFRQVHLGEGNSDLKPGRQCVGHLYCVCMASYRVFSADDISIISIWADTIWVFITSLTLL